MKYKDGVPMTKSNHILICPRCENEEFSSNSDYCRICGSSAYNRCEGVWDEREEILVQHENPGNARFCEICGKPTFFFIEQFLKPWDSIETEDDDDFFPMVESSTVVDE